MNATRLFGGDANVTRRYLTLYDIDVAADGSAGLRIAISAVYSLVCGAGLLGNLIVVLLMRAKQRWRKSAVNTLVLGLALTDFHFVLVLPFWAADVALDYSWPFGRLMCKLVSATTLMNMYASVFFLTAICVTRYRYIAAAMRARPRPTSAAARWVCVLIWLSAALVAAPHAVFASTRAVSGDVLCLVRFPGSEDAAQFWLGLYQLQKVLLGFALPLLVISICYLLLLRYLRCHGVPGERRKWRVTLSITVVVLSFFLCWLPNHAVTLWGVLVKHNAVPFGSAFYTAHTYVFPATVCLAHANSCLDPVLYCLMRAEFRKRLARALHCCAQCGSPVAASRRCRVRPMEPRDSQQQEQQLQQQAIMQEQQLQVQQMCAADLLQAADGDLISAQGQVALPMQER
ncbi:relaxin-3 receptor 1-like [Lethenteron reissneri]|uniref:relaxin-3 receptor 1-like n=1 Tax=Lethenteron reissneri TaxID=7753 RepID=UPI002AB6935D|nr:relaxin-3 receptor 1-like [Lethenteron reissneri]